MSNLTADDLSIKHVNQIKEAWEKDRESLNQSKYETNQLILSNRNLQSQLIEITNEVNFERRLNNLSFNLISNSGCPSMCVSDIMDCLSVKSKQTCQLICLLKNHNVVNIWNSNDSNYITGNSTIFDSIINLNLKQTSNCIKLSKEIVDTLLMVISNDNFSIYQSDLIDNFFHLSLYALIPDSSCIWVILPLENILLSSTTLNLSNVLDDAMMVLQTISSYVKTVTTLILYSNNNFMMSLTSSIEQLADKLTNDIDNINIYSWIDVENILKTQLNSEYLYIYLVQKRLTSSKLLSINSSNELSIRISVDKISNYQLSNSISRQCFIISEYLKFDDLINVLSNKQHYCKSNLFIPLWECVCDDLTACQCDCYGYLVCGYADEYISRYDADILEKSLSSISNRIKSAVIKSNNKTDSLINIDEFVYQLLNETTLIDLSNREYHDIQIDISNNFNCDWCICLSTGFINQSNITLNTKLYNKNNEIVLDRLLHQANFYNPLKVLFSNENNLFNATIAVYLNQIDIKTDGLLDLLAITYHLSKDQIEKYDFSTFHILLVYLPVQNRNFETNHILILLANQWVPWSQSSCDTVTNQMNNSIYKAIYKYNNMFLEDYISSIKSDIKSLSNEMNNENKFLDIISNLSSDLRILSNSVNQSNTKELNYLSTFCNTTISDTITTNTIRKLFYFLIVNSMTELFSSSNISICHAYTYSNNFENWSKCYSLTNTGTWIINNDPPNKLSNCYVTIYSNEIILSDTRINTSLDIFIFDDSSNKVMISTSLLQNIQLVINIFINDHIDICLGINDMKFGESPFQHVTSILDKNITNSLNICQSDIPLDSLELNDSANNVDSRIFCNKVEKSDDNRFYKIIINTLLDIQSEVFPQFVFTPITANVFASTIDEIVLYTHVNNTYNIPLSLSEAIIRNHKEWTSKSNSFIILDQLGRSLVDFLLGVYIQYNYDCEIQKESTQAIYPPIVIYLPNYVNERSRQLVGLLVQPLHNAIISNLLIDRISLVVRNIYLSSTSIIYKLVNHSKDIINGLALSACAPNQLNVLIHRLDQHIESIFSEQCDRVLTFLSSTFDRIENSNDSIELINPESQQLITLSELDLSNLLILPVYLNSVLSLKYDIINTSSYRLISSTNKQQKIIRIFMCLSEKILSVTMIWLSPVQKSIESNLNESKVGRSFKLSDTYNTETTFLIKSSSYSIISIGLIWIDSYKEKSRCLQIETLTNRLRLAIGISPNKESVDNIDNCIEKQSEICETIIENCENNFAKLREIEESNLNYQNQLRSFDESINIMTLFMRTLTHLYLPDNILNDSFIQNSLVKSNITMTLQVNSSSFYHESKSYLLLQLVNRVKSIFSSKQKCFNNSDSYINFLSFIKDIIDRYLTNNLLPDNITKQKSDTVDVQIIPISNQLNHVNVYSNEILKKCIDSCEEVVVVDSNNTNITVYYIPISYSSNQQSRNVYLLTNPFVNPLVSSIGSPIGKKTDTKLEQSKFINKPTIFTAAVAQIIVHGDSKLDELDRLIVDALVQSVRLILSNDLSSNLSKQLSNILSTIQYEIKHINSSKSFSNNSILRNIAAIKLSLPIISQLLKCNCCLLSNSKSKRNIITNHRQVYKWDLVEQTIREDGELVYIDKTTTNLPCNLSMSYSTSLLTPSEPSSVYQLILPLTVDSVTNYVLMETIHRVSNEDIEIIRLIEKVVLTSIESLQFSQEHNELLLRTNKNEELSDHLYSSSLSSTKFQNFYRDCFNLLSNNPPHVNSTALILEVKQMIENVIDSKLDKIELFNRFEIESYFNLTFQLINQNPIYQHYKSATNTFINNFTISEVIDKLRPPLVPILLIENITIYYVVLSLDDLNHFLVIASSSNEIFLKFFDNKSKSDNIIDNKIEQQSDMNSILNAISNIINTQIKLKSNENYLSIHKNQSDLTEHIIGILSKQLKTIENYISDNSIYSIEQFVSCIYLSNDYFKCRMYWNDKSNIWSTTSIISEFFTVQDLIKNRSWSIESKDIKVGTNTLIDSSDEVATIYIPIITNSVIKFDSSLYSDLHDNINISEFLQTILPVNFILGISSTRHNDVLLSLYQSDTKTILFQAVSDLFIKSINYLYFTISYNVFNYTNRVIKYDISTYLTIFNNCFNEVSYPVNKIKSIDKYLNNIINCLLEWYPIESVYLLVNNTSNDSTIYNNKLKSNLKYNNSKIDLPNFISYYIPDSSIISSSSQHKDTSNDNKGVEYSFSNQNVKGRLVVYLRNQSNVKISNFLSDFFINLSKCLSKRIFEYIELNELTISLSNTQSNFISLENKNAEIVRQLENKIFQYQSNEKDLVLSNESLKDELEKANLIISQLNQSMNQSNEQINKQINDNNSIINDNKILVKQIEKLNKRKKLVDTENLEIKEQLSQLQQLHENYKLENNQLIKNLKKDLKNLKNDLNIAIHNNDNDNDNKLSICLNKLRKCELDLQLSRQTNQLLQDQVNLGNSKSNNKSYSKINVNEIMNELTNEKLKNEKLNNKINQLLSDKQVIISGFNEINDIIKS